jgi:deoxyribodipyrimidine photo-lyase
MTGSDAPPATVAWFRRDLRLDDNPAWDDACGGEAPVIALYVLDPVPLATAGPLRRDLLACHLRALDAELRAGGGGLLVLEGDPRDLVPAVVTAVGAARLVLNADPSAYARRRDRAVCDRVVKAGAAVTAHWGSLVQPPGAVVSPSTGRVHRVFTPFHRAWAQVPWVPWPGHPSARATPADPRRLARVLGDLPLVDVPTPAAPPVMAPGEHAAVERLQRWLDEVDGYGARRDRPDDPTGTSHLSADLRWGTLSPRKVIRVVGTATRGRAAFVRQLAWRDWYAHLLWDQPSLSTSALKPEMDRIRWRHDPDGFRAWAEGRTGYPIVDAGMRELAATGWMHNRVRMIAASFLVKDLLIDWRLGEAHFRRLLVDFDLSQNVGNWQWVAGTGPDAAPYFRVFNPVTQGRKFDPDGTYVRRWVPELASLDGPALHAPWEVGPLELAAAGVTLGETYPRPLVDHGAARDRALAAYGAAREESPTGGRDLGPG